MDALRTLIIIILVFVMLRLLARILMPYLMKYLSKKIQKRFERQFGGQFGDQFGGAKPEPEGSVHVTSKGTKSTSSSKVVGDYIDYEEID